MKSDNRNPTSNAPTKDEIDRKAKEKQKDDLERKRLTYEGQIWTGVLKFVGFKGKTIHLPCQLKWISPTSEATAPGPIIGSAEPAKEIPFEDDECFRMLVTMGTELCGKGEKVQGILTFQKNEKTIYGRREDCLSNIIEYSPPHITILAGDNLLNRGSFHFSIFANKVSQIQFQ